MDITVRIPTPLRQTTNDQKEVTVPGETVAEVLDALKRTYPDLGQRICDDAGEIRSYISIFVNEDDIRSLQGKGTPLGQGDRLSIIPAIAGGLHLTKSSLSCT